MSRQKHVRRRLYPPQESRHGQSLGCLGQRGRGKRGPWLRMTHQHRPIRCDMGDSELRCDPKGPQTDPQTRHKPNTALKQSLFKKQPPPPESAPPGPPPSTQCQVGTLLPRTFAPAAQHLPSPSASTTEPTVLPVQQAPVPGTQRHQPGARLLLGVRVHDPQSRAGKTGDALVSQRERRSPS